MRSGSRGIRRRPHFERNEATAIAQPRARYRQPDLLVGDLSRRRPQAYAKQHSASLRQLFSSRRQDVRRSARRRPGVRTPVPFAERTLSLKQIWKQDVTGQIGAFPDRGFADESNPAEKSLKRPLMPALVFRYLEIAENLIFRNSSRYDLERGRVSRCHELHDFVQRSVL